MFEELSNQDLARLHAKFVVPIVIDQMLRDEEPLDDIAEHAINEILTELCPDTALLCIAMCARHVARETSFLAIGQALEMACRQIIDEYGPLWIAHEKNPDMLNNDNVRDLLAYLPEDLEAMRDLLESLMGELDEDHCIAAILCDILSLQADYHRDIAEVELGNINVSPQRRPEQNEFDGFVLETVDYGGHGDNVVAFPGAYTSVRQKAQQ